MRNALAGGGAVLAVAASATAAVLVPGRLAPHQTGNGRVLRPTAKLVKLGHFPTGGVISPDGRLYFAVSTGRGLNDVRAVRLTGRAPKVAATLPLPGASGGVAADRRRRILYVSGLQDSAQTDQQRPGRPGRKGDVVHVIAYTKRGRMHETGTIPVPPPADAPPPQNFPPTNAAQKLAYPERLAVSPDGSTLLVALGLGDAAAVVNTRTKAVRTVATGRMPYGAAILPGGRTGLVSNETAGTVSVIDLATAREVKEITVGTHLSHAEHIALNRKGTRAYVTLANTDQVAVVDTRKRALERTISVERPWGGGVSPVASAVTKDGRRLLVAEASADELAVVPLAGRGRFRVAGRIPTAAYPADVQLTKGGRVLWLAAKGFGSGANPNGPNPYNANDDSLLKHPGTAVLSRGIAGVQPMPSARRLRRFT